MTGGAWIFHDTGTRQRHLEKIKLISEPYRVAVQVSTIDNGCMRKPRTWFLCFCFRGLILRFHIILSLHFELISDLGKDLCHNWLITNGKRIGFGSQPYPSHHLNQTNTVYSFSQSKNICQDFVWSIWKDCIFRAWLNFEI